MSKENHIVHYIGVDLAKNICLRYFFNFEDKKSLIGKWVISSNDTGDFGVINEHTASITAASHGKSLDDYEEVIGRLLPNGMYQKILVISKNDNYKSKVFFEPNVIVSEIDKSIIKIED